MGFKDISQIAGSAMAAQSVRLNTIASNLANADVAAGSESEAYRRVHEPDNPKADAEGMVFYTNVNEVAEMADMMSASRAFETNVEVLGRIKSMQQSLLKLGEG
jgi:flagellar basal-body rod protein FlgC